jgi:Zn-dependent protease
MVGIKGQRQPQATREHPEVVEQRQKSITVSMFIAMTVSTFVALSLLFGRPLFGSLLLSWIVLGALTAIYFFLLAAATNLAKARSDIHMLPAESQNDAVKAVMDVRVALEEEGIQTYQGNLMYPSEIAFEELRSRTEPQGILAMLQPDEKVDATVALIPRNKRPDLQRRPINATLHVVLFILTMITTTIAGALHEGVNLLTSPGQFTVGLPYSLALMAVLGLHELGHYLVARKYQMDVTPPYFMPAPFALGTFGAFISMRSPSVNRKSMFDTSIAGPALGFVVAVVLLLIGLQTSTPGKALFDSPLLSPYVGSSMMFTLIATMVNPALQYGASLDLNPIAFAGWLGLLVTALNLIPIGQLDGGHVLQAMLGPKWGTTVSSISSLALLALALFVWPALLLFAFIAVLIAGRPSAALDGITPIGTWRNIAGVVAMLVLVMIFAPMPESVYTFLR